MGQVESAGAAYACTLFTLTGTCHSTSTSEKATQKFCILTGTSRRNCHLCPEGAYIRRVFR